MAVVENGRRILVVDDQRAIHDDLRKLLSAAPTEDLNRLEGTLFGDTRRRPEPFDIDSAYQGEEGVGMVRQALAEARPYALATIDMRMPPGWDGLYTIEKMWELDPDLQIVICTAYSDSSWQEIRQRFGATDRLLILKKPFDLEEVCQLAYAMTEKWRLARQARLQLGALNRMVEDQTGELEQLRVVTNLIANGDLSARFQMADGAARPDDLGRAVNAMAVALETRQRERDEAERQRRLLAAIVEDTDDAVVAHTLDGVILSWNAGAEKLFGFMAAEAIGQSLSIVIPADRTLELSTNLDEQGRGERVKHRETVRQRKDGSLVAVSLTLSPIRDESGKIIGGAGIIRDITERQRAEEALRDAEARMRFALEASRVGVWEHDPIAGRVFWSTTLEEMHGLQPGTFGGHLEDFIATVHPDEREIVVAALAQGVRDRRDVELEYRILWPDGTERRLATTGHYTFNEAGEFIRGAGVTTDVTEQRSLEDQLRQAQKMDAVGRLAGGIAHDFNNMLTAILGNAEFLRDGIPEDDPRRAEVDEISKAGQRAATLTHQLLAFSRKQLMVPRVLHLGHVVGEVTVMLRRLLGETIDLQAISSERGDVKADAGQMQQILLNLAVNARDAMREGGRLTIETTDVVVDDAQARQHPGLRPGSYVMIAVRDTGHGMDATTQARIFEPFFTTKPVGQGTGLGLATVYGIVKQTGGYITVWSEVGRGTTFRIYLPRTEELEEAPQAAARDIRAPRGTENVLVVEDEEIVRQFVQKTLSQHGYTVQAIGDPTQAIDFADTHPDAIDIIVTDVVLPDMSGPTMAARLLRRHPESQVLYMSGYTDDAIVQHGVLDGQLWFLPKPFSAEALARKVRDVLDARPMRPQSAFQ